MEKCILRIKLKAPGNPLTINSPLDIGNATLIVKDTAVTEITSSSEEYIPQSNRKNMKRKRGHKTYQRKGKQAKLTKDLSSDLVSSDTKDNLNLEPSDDNQHGSEVKPEPHNGSNTPSVMSNTDTEAPIGRISDKKGHPRVKVKLKSARVSEPYKSGSDAQTPSETEKSNPQVAPSVVESAAEKEESTFSDGQTSDMNNTISDKLCKKKGSIKIKSSLGLGFPSEIKQDRNPSKLVISSELPSKKKSVVAETARTVDTSVPRNKIQRERTLPSNDPRYSEKELNAALVVIKKVMKMEAADPFNTPVDPVALGIPDYFDIIDTPMDFGTIVQNLESRFKYLNSEGVFKDVQYIWDNCYKYNNKGDYVVDLMKRVKKNFMKYWLASGLYSDISGIVDETQTEDISRSGQDKQYSKSKSKHKRRRYGIDQHKSDCLCAVCAVRRRRKEREENSIAVENQAETSDHNMSRELKIEFATQESSAQDIPCSEDATSSMDRLPEIDTNANGEDDNEEKFATPSRVNSAQMEKQEMDIELGFEQNDSGGNNQSSQHSFENGRKNSKSEFQGQFREVMQPGEQKDDTTLNVEASYHYSHMNQNQEESHGQDHLTKTQKFPQLQENKLMLQLCKSLFPSDRRSVWNGPHSLNRGSLSFRNSAIHDALESLMK
ncbi:bromodomain-containing factor 2-like isoform X1 [Zingiber officinale]|uniref:bromodomain-containing factor 2-like isoform X1 n=1 Tax=Zingiber officinale TaxID=94328 RepID=UPI001C4B98FD|nr:bromodomain-containing factor 2-like isoform X1 [Zingiber officinale]XP_042470869.1 bromodomain-containing factor 2-like isoform X1 [Zingiber officinale]